MRPLLSQKELWISVVFVYRESETITSNPLKATFLSNCGIDKMAAQVICPTEVWLMNNSIFIALYLHFWSLIREIKSFRHRNLISFVCILKLLFVVSQWNIWFQYNELKAMIFMSRVHKLDSNMRCLQSQCTAIWTQNDF